MLAGTICSEQQLAHSTYLNLLKNVHFRLFGFDWGAGVALDGVHVNEGCAIHDDLSRFGGVACAEIVRDVHGRDGLVGKDAARY